MIETLGLRNLSLISRITGDLFWLLDHVLGVERVNLILGRRRKAFRERIILELKKNGPPKRGQIKRVKDISVEAFKRDYLHPCIPVVLEGAAKEWNCVKNWSPEYLSREFGSDPVALIDASPEKLEEANFELEYTTLGEVLASMGSGPLSKYSRFNTILKDHPELVKDMDFRFLMDRRNLIASGKTFQVFIGGKGTKTNTHAACEHNLFTQVYGKKHWVIYPPQYDAAIDPDISRTPYFVTGFDPDKPDYKRFPAMEYADSLECDIGPGDVLFVPPSWWHYVTNTEDSMGFGFRWFSIDSFKVDFLMTLLMGLSIDPPIWVATQQRDNFVKIFSYRARRAKRMMEKRVKAAQFK